MKNVEEASAVVRITLEYNIQTGAFNMLGNVRDEIITNGMLEMAKDRMREQYNLQRLANLKAKHENGLVAPGGVQILT